MEWVEIIDMDATRGHRQCWNAREGINVNPEADEG